MRSCLPCLVAAFLAFSGPPVSAQEPKGEMPSTLLRTLALSPKVKPEVYVFSEDEYRQLPFSHYQPSSGSFEVSVPGGSLTIFRKGRDEAGKVEFQPIKKVAVPVGTRRVLLLGVEAPGGAYNFVAVGDNMRMGDDREWLLINATPYAMAFQLGAETKPIPVSGGKSVPFRIDVETGSGASVRVAGYIDDGWERFYSSFWPVYEGQRGLVIFVPDERKKVRLMNFFESVREENTEDAGAGSP